MCLTGLIEFSGLLRTVPPRQAFHAQYAFDMIERDEQETAFLAMREVENCKDLYEFLWQMFNDCFKQTPEQYYWEEIKPLEDKGII